VVANFHIGHTIINALARQIKRMKRKRNKDTKKFFIKKIRGGHKAAPSRCVIV